MAKTIYSSLDEPEYTSDKYVYEIYKVLCDGSNKTQICTIELPHGSYLDIGGFEEAQIEWWTRDGNYSMDISNPYDIRLDEQRAIISSFHCRYLCSLCTDGASADGNSFCGSSCRTDPCNT